MDAILWGTSEDGTIQYQSLTEEYMDDALLVMRDVFFFDENISIALELNIHPEAVDELITLCKDAAKDGVSLIAVEKSTNKVVAAAFNKIQTKESPDGEESFFEMFAKTCKQERSRGLVEYLIEADGLCNLFDHCKVDALMEIMFLATFPDYRKKGIGRKLCEVSFEVARKLRRGENVKRSIDRMELPLSPVPEIVTAVFTTFITQKIGTQLGFVVAAERNYDSIVHCGRNFGDYIDKSTPKMTLEYKRI